MTSNDDSSEQPHLVSLVLQSKKALQHGEQLCVRANELSVGSALMALDVRALDARVRWLSGAVIEQLNLAATVAKSIKEKRAQLDARVRDWDAQRIQRTDALDAILDSLGKQLVPPDFHQSSPASSLFGSQHADDEAEGEDGDVDFGQVELARRTTGKSHLPHNGKPMNGTASFTMRSPTSTLRSFPKTRKSTVQQDREKWKTLRDFVDERAIGDALESLENDRVALEDVLGTTDEFAETLTSTIDAIRNSLPSSSMIDLVEKVLLAQAKLSTTMAGHLDSLTAHFDNMAEALKESEAGEVFSQEDLQEMNRDTEELPAIMAELEESVVAIKQSHKKLLQAKSSSNAHLEAHSLILDDLEELERIMGEMLLRQSSVETDCDRMGNEMAAQLVMLEDLRHRFVAYQSAFDKLLVEVGRRKLYKEAAENIVRGMISQLDAMTEEERMVRAEFNADQGSYLPEDLCMFIENPPMRWDVVPWNGEPLEVIPDIDPDLLAEAREKMEREDGLLSPLKADF